MMIAVMPMATMLFQCTLGNVLTYSVFTPSGGRPGPQGQPDGSWGGQSGGFAQQSGRNNNAPVGALAQHTPGPQPSQQSDVTKQGPSVVRTH
jgi:type IV secretion system protein VirB6